MNIRFLLLFIFFQSIIIAQSQDILNTNLKDTLQVNFQADLKTSKDDSQTIPIGRYVEILEKVNRQLGSWTNSYGIAIMFLSALFTIMAILVAYSIYRQGKDYKKKFDDFLKDNQKAFDELIEEKRRILKLSEGTTSESIRKKEEELEKAPADQKSKVQEKINELINFRNYISHELVQDKTKLSTSIPTRKNNNLYICPYCGHATYYEPYLNTIHGSHEIFCSECQRSYTIKRS